MSRITIGRLTKPHGIKGALWVEPLTDFPDRFLQLRKAFIASKDQVFQANVGVRSRRGRFILQIEGIATRTEAEKLVNAYVEVEEEHLAPLGRNEFFLFQIIGSTVFTVDGQSVGTVKDVWKFPAHDLWVVKGERGEVLVPAVGSIVEKVDLEEKKIVIRPPAGLL